jgi:FkbM family methyltransferase
MKYSKFFSLLNYIILKTYFVSQKNRILKSFHYKIYSYLKKNYNKVIKGKIHGSEVFYNFGYTYPITSRRYHTFNNPYLDLVSISNEGLNRPINIIDIGAAIGDTALFIQSNASNKINEIVCIDGDIEFFKYLEVNLIRQKNIRAIKAMLSDIDNILTPELIRIHEGTASAQGEKNQISITLDSLLMSDFDLLNKIDVLKIDVDGFDGKVLSGAIKILENFTPDVIFEWHPKLYLKTKNDIHTPFKILNEAGYNRFYWYTKFGTFSHFSETYSEENINKYSDYCLNSLYDSDLHFDIIAIHKSKKYKDIDFANMEFSKNKVSQF